MKKSILFMMLSSLLLASCVDGGGDEQPTDESGNKIHANCYGKFDKNGNIVAFKLSDTSKWEMIGDNCSIPDYAYHITSVFQDI